MTSSHSLATSEHPLLSAQDATSEERQSRSSASSSKLARLKKSLSAALVEYPDWPEKDVTFIDILPIFRSPLLHESLIDALELHILETYGKDNKPDFIVGLDARGFLFGPSLALRLRAGFVPVRKKGKLPGNCETESFQKEYGPDFFQMQGAGIDKGQKILVVDDIIATGGSAAAAGSLVTKLGGELIGFVFILELDFLHGRDKLHAPVYTLLSSHPS